MTTPVRFILPNAFGEPDRRAWPSEFFTMTLDHLAVWAEARPIEPGRLGLTPEKPVPFALQMLWDVPAFGRVWVTADNAGVGYVAGWDQNEMNLVFEMARSRLTRVRHLRDEMVAEGMTVPPETIKRITQANALVHSAGLPDRSPAEITAASNQALSLGMWAGEELVMAQARRRLPRADKARLAAFHFGGKLWNEEGCAPDWDPRSLAPDFTVGSVGHDTFPQLFDFMTVNVYRRSLEAREGALEWPLRDRLIAYGKEHNLPMKGHPLAWGHTGGQPFWMRYLSFPSLKDVVRRQILETVDRLKADIHAWDVINEASDWPPANIWQLTQAEQIEMTGVACETPAWPTRPRCVWSTSTPSGATISSARRAARAACAPGLRYFQDVIAAGVPFEVLGLQLYYPNRDLWRSRT